MARRSAYVKLRAEYECKNDVIWISQNSNDQCSIKSQKQPLVVSPDKTASSKDAGLVSSLLTAGNWEGLKEIHCKQTIISVS